MKLEKRKNTTLTALKEAQTLLEFIEKEMTDDLFNFKSNPFKIRLERDNGLFRNDFNYSSWIDDQAILLYKNGEILVKTYNSDENNGCISEYNTMGLVHLNKVDFLSFSESLNDLIEKYNELTIRKDEEISEFLSKVNEILKIKL